MARGFVSRLVRPELDSGRVARTHRRFDRDCRYEQFHDFCRDRLLRSVPDAETALERHGVEQLRVWAEADASRLLDRIRSGFRAIPFRRNGGRVHEYRIDDADFTSELLAAALTPAVDARVVRFFRSEYFVHWFVITRAQPQQHGNFNSFRWHCDKGPRAHLKLLVYLNGHEEHGGATEFLDLATTREFERSGYLFGAVADRRSDLSSLAVRAGAPYCPDRWRGAAGEASLFTPSRVLHRGVMPNRKPRYMLGICLLPSPIPWRAALERGWLSDLRHDSKWHGDAMVLARESTTV
jgi:hypothetical protein